MLEQIFSWGDQDPHDARIHGDTWKCMQKEGKPCPDLMPARLASFVFRTRMTRVSCYAYRVETGPYYVMQDDHSVMLCLSS